MIVVNDIVCLCYCKSYKMIQNGANIISISHFPVKNQENYINKTSFILFLFKGMRNNAIYSA